MTWSLGICLTKDNTEVTSSSTQIKHENGDILSLFELDGWYILNTSPKFRDNYQNQKTIKI